jgi:hypothetical protein
MTAVARAWAVLRRRVSLGAAPAALASLMAAGLLAGCASDPARLGLGGSRAEVLQRLGTPTSTYALSGGGERLQYSRTPAGTEVSNVDLDAGGRVVSNRQELDESLFERTIQIDAWREADVLRTYGRPYEIREVHAYEGKVWTWRYRVAADTKLLHIYIDPTGRVTRYHTGADLTREWLRW